MTPDRFSKQIALQEVTNHEVGCGYSQKFQNGFHCHFLRASKLI